MSEQAETGLWGPDHASLDEDTLPPMDDLERRGIVCSIRQPVHISITVLQLTDRSRRMRARMAAIEEAIGEAWVRGAKGDLALAIRMKTRALEVDQ